VAGTADGLVLAEKTVVNDVEALSSLSALSSDMVAAISSCLVLPVLSDFTLPDSCNLI